MGISKINTLSYIKDKGLYSELTFQKYKYLFNYFQTDVNFISHGNISNWIDILSCLPSIETSHVNFSNGAIRIGHPSEIGLHGKKILEEKLLELSPWRKGPFILFGTEIDSEWRSYKKWNRIKPFLPLDKGIRICDIGCSNGYYLYKLLETEPEIAIGVEKTPLYIMQFLATKIYAKKIQEILVIPSSVENFQQEKIDFDLVLSMGVLYHSKAPEAHIETIKKILKKNGSLILETIITNNTKNIYVKKGQSFAGMKNISIIFNEKNVIHLLKSCGFKNIECVNKSITDYEEQRSTKWMKGKSLKDFIYPNGTTIEGHSDFYRAIFIARKK